MTTTFTYEGASPDAIGDDAQRLHLSNLGAGALLAYLGMPFTWEGEVHVNTALAVFTKVAKSRRIRRPEHIVSRALVLFTAAQRAGCRTVTFG